MQDVAPYENISRLFDDESLVHTRDDAVRHNFAILIPLISVLVAASSLVSLAAVVQEDAHEDEIRPRQDVAESAGRTPGPSLDEVGKVVGMPGNTPPTGRQEDSVVLLAVRSAVFASDELSLAAPDASFVLMGPNMVSLEIGLAEHGVAEESNGYQGSRLKRRKVCRVASQVLHLKSVESRQKGAVSPSKHESEVIMADVDCPEVPVLVVEEVDNIRGLEDENNQHRLSDMSQSLVLIRRPGEADQ